MGGNSQIRKVVVLQEYVPHYRVPFFEAAIALARSRSIDLVVAAGTPNRSQSKRQDAAIVPWARNIRQRELRLVGRRIVLRKTKSLTSSADLVVMEQARRNLDLYMTLLNPFRTHLIALWGHGKDEVHKPSKFETRLQQKLTRRADWFFAYTSEGGRHVSQLGLAAERISVLNNTTDGRSLIDDIRGIQPNDSLLFRRKNGLQKEYVLFLGALDSSKRLDFLADVASILQEDHPLLQVAIAGDGPLREEVESWAKGAMNVVMIGRVSGTQKALALEGCRFLVNPGRVGLLTTDSFASQRPIVTTKWQGHAPEFEYLTSGMNALVVEDDARKYAEVVGRLSEDDNQLFSLREGCRRSANQFSVDKMAESFVDGVERALDLPK